MSKEQQERQSYGRLATPRELHLLVNVWQGRNKNATQDHKRLGRWSEEQLNASLSK